ncbi:MAG: capsid protein [Lachnospiraceae bacterium]|nr:capsid protein [Lachnospiraceae bacterium]
MRWVQKLNERIKHGVRSWLNVQPAGAYGIQINEVLDFELSAIRNRIWYRGDGNELEQMYQQNPEWADRYKFWASKSSPGMEMRKIHTGLPGLIVRILTAIVLTDMNPFDFAGNEAQKRTWEILAKENKFPKKLEKALKEVLFAGDGAFKVTIDTDVSEYPILEWYPGERIEIIRHRDRVKEIVFKTPYKAGYQQYVLLEHYGFGYIKNELYLGENPVKLDALEATKDIKDVTFDKSVMLAVPLQVYESAKYEGRGGSLYDGKLDSFDALDETWSQWMDALRAGRAKTYIPECLIPKNPHTGEILRPNAFDNRYIQSDSDMHEGSKNQIDTEQPSIPHESYLASYCTALDLCLQGIVSPSTLGIDVKKLDNAEAQREKEKATLYTRDAIIQTLQEALPELVGAALNAYRILLNQPVEEIQVTVPFGEYANPSFESQVETLAKARPGVPLMSVEAQIEELYGDSKDEDWKQEEVARLKAEQGIVECEEPAVRTFARGFSLNTKEGEMHEGKDNEPRVPNGAG